MSNLIPGININTDTALTSHANALATARANEKVDATAFGQIFDATMQLFDDTNALQRNAEQLQLDYITGRTNDMLAVILAQEKANTSLSFTVQVTNRVIESYREIMRMQL